MLVILYLIKQLFKLFGFEIGLNQNIYINKNYINHVKIDFTKPITVLKKYKLTLILFGCCLFSFFIYTIHYTIITKQYILLIINFAFGLVVYILFDVIIGKKLYNTEFDINQSNNRKNDTIKENIISKKRENHKKQ